MIVTEKDYGALRVVGCVLRLGITPCPGRPGRAVTGEGVPNLSAYFDGRLDIRRGQEVAFGADGDFFWV